MKLFFYIWIFVVMNDEIIRKYLDIKHIFS